MGYNYLDKEKLQYLLVTLRNKLASTFTKRDTFDAITGGRINENLTNVEYTTQTVSGDEFMPLTALNQHGNLVNAVKEVSSKVANMFSSLSTYFATKQELAVKADKNVYASNSRTPGYGSSGYVAFARLRVKSAWQNTPVEFELLCRGRHRSCHVSIQFENGNTTDPNVLILSYAGSNYGVFAHKVEESVWDLYYTKSEPYDSLTVTRVSQVYDTYIEVTHPDTYLATKPTTNVVEASLGWAVASAETATSATSATSATTATSATKATQDGSGNVITSTYAKKSVYNNSNAYAYITSNNVNIVDNKTYSNVTYFGTSYPNVAYKTVELQVDSNGSNYFEPTIDNDMYLGSSKKRWKQIFAATSTISTSDRKAKKDIKNMDDNILDFVMGLKPSTYKFVKNDSNRTHFGLIAQDVEELLENLEMSTQEFAGFIKTPKTEVVEELVECEIETEDGKNETIKVPIMSHKIIENEYDYGLRYEEFIPAIIKVVQLQQKEIERLKQNSKKGV